MIFLTIGKCDLINNTKTLAISGKTGDGLDALLKEISLKLTNLSIGAQTATRERHRVAMISAQKYLDAGKLLVSDELELSELASSEFHQGIQCLSSLIGSVGVEDLLDEIFQAFAWVNSKRIILTVIIQLFPFVFDMQYRYKLNINGCFT